MSFFTLFTAGLACLVPFASAYTTPVGDTPEGNPIFQPGLNSIVQVGETFTITWDPTTEGTVSLVLLKGPSENIKPLYAIAEKIENSGSYAWDPKDDLEPGTTGYGIQLIVDSTGQYQYTTQFGISNPDYNAVKAVSPSAYASSSSTTSTTAKATGTASKYVHTASHIASNTTLTTSAIAIPLVTGAPISGYLPHNSSIVRPTGSVGVPNSLKTSATLSTSPIASATVSTPPSSTGAASNLAASFGGLVIAAAVAVFAL